MVLDLIFFINGLKNLVQKVFKTNEIEQVSPFLGICFLYKINSILVWMEKNIQPTLNIFKPISKNAQSMFLKNILLLINYTRRRFYQF